MNIKNLSGGSHLPGLRLLCHHSRTFLCGSDLSYTVGSRAQGTEPARHWSARHLLLTCHCAAPSSISTAVCAGTGTEERTPWVWISKSSPTLPPCHLGCSLHIWVQNTLQEKKTGVVAYTNNPSAPKPETSRSLRSRSTWTT